MRKLLAGLLILIFIPIYVFVLLTFNFQSVLLNKENIKSSLKEGNLYEKFVPSIVSDYLGDNYSEDGSLTTFSKKEFIELLNKVFPPSSLQNETEKTIDAVYPYILSQTDEFNLVYDFKGYKSAFSAEFESITLEKIDALPECTDNKLNDLDSDTLCKPVGVDRSELLQNDVDLSYLLTTVLWGQEVQIPDKISITKERIKSTPETSRIDLDESPGVFLDNIRNPVSGITKALGAGFAVLFVILVLIALLRLGSYKSMARWVGWALLTSSLVTGLIGLVIILSTEFIESYVEALGETATLFSGVILILTNKVIMGGVIPQSIVIFIVSLALIIIPSFIKRKEQPQTPS